MQHPTLSFFSKRVCSSLDEDGDEEEEEQEKEKEKGNASALASCYVEKVLATGSIDFDVSLTNMVLVASQSHVAMLFVGESHEGFSVPSALRTEAKSDATTEQNEPVMK